MKKFIMKIRDRYSLFARISFLLFICAIVLHLVFRLIPSFADLFNRHISSVFRAFFSYLTILFPFSVAETVILSLPLAVFLLIFVPSYLVWESGKQADDLRRIAAQRRVSEIAVEEYRLKAKAAGQEEKESSVSSLTDRDAPAPEEIEASEIEKEADTRVARLMGNLFAVVMLFYVVFVLTFSAGYLGTTLDEKLSLDREPVSNMELYTTAKQLLDEIDPLLDEIEFQKNGASKMSFSREEMNSLLNDAYGKAAEKYAFLPVLRSKLKYIALSDLMTYTHISGVYSYYTGEANVNWNYPDYTIPYTSAHEMAHQRGIAREDEASFTAFLVCMESDDPYIRYSALLSVFDYVASALYQADKTLYSNVYSGLDERIRNEEKAFSIFFDKYRNSVASTVSGKVNDTYLKLQGQSAGSKSYDLVVDLAVAYYKSVGISDE